MSDQIQDRPTWVYFQLSNPILALELAQLVESQILSLGLKPVGEIESRMSASSSLPSGKTERDGVRIIDVILEEGPLLLAASARYKTRDGNLKISLRIGDFDIPPFDARTPLKNFLLRVNYRMDSKLLRQIFEIIPDQEEFDMRLGNSKIAYKLVKQLFHATSAEKCIGVDDRYVTGKYFADPPAFYFSQIEPWILSDLLEDNI